MPERRILQAGKGKAADIFAAFIIAPGKAHFNRFSLLDK
jgi:hypothetical protein